MKINSTHGSPIKWMHSVQRNNQQKNNNFFKILNKTLQETPIIPTKIKKDNHLNVKQNPSTKKINQTHQFVMLQQVQEKIVQIFQEIMNINI
ncbi:hypothetical protein [Buchnera aphidicola]|uniref:hypothetical protein n=1 Tax=Buchnera aphidicola TaxID=9 RepID=UPI00094D8980|nr:hypothetical protein [Buchnera aphidicola]